MDSHCEECENDRFIIDTCCSGYQCGCMGMPVVISPCKACNPDGKKKASTRLSDNHWFEYLEDNA